MATKEAERNARLDELASGNDVDVQLVRETLERMQELGFTGPRYDVEGPYGRRSLLLRCKGTSGA